MRTLALPLAAAALLALGAVVVVSALSAPAAPLSRAEEAARLAAELRCPDCQALSVADSPTESAAEIRRQIDALLAEGRSPDEVRRHFVERYGQWILLAPSAPLAWLVPLAALVAGLAAFAVWLARRGARRQAVASDRRLGPSAPDLQRVRDEVEALDA